MRFLLLLPLFLSAFSLQAQSAADVYIDKFDSLALEVMYTYGIPASLVLGTALHESGLGTSKLCRINHNHFGVKGRVKSHKTKSGYVYMYRRFDSDEEAYLFWGEMISRKKYYSKLKGDMDYMEWLKAMKASKYAASSKWIFSVEKIIRRNDLSRFDKLAFQQLIPFPGIIDTIPYFQN